MKLNGTGTPIRINGNNIDLGEALPHKVQEELLHVIEAHFGRLNHATVGFTRDGHWYCCTITVPVGNLTMIVAEASAGACHQAFDQALAKIGRHLHRRSRRVVATTRREPSAPALA